MTDMDNTTSGIVWQWLAEHKQDVLDYFASIMREASDIQLVGFDADRHMGLLATYVYQGIHRVDNVKPASLVEGLSGLTDDLRRRCEDAAAEAEREATYAKTQGDRVNGAMTDFATLYAKVEAQGDTAEQQGANAQTIYEAVNTWYSPFKTDAERWLTVSKADFADWFATRQAAWDAWYTEGIVPDWNAFWAGVQADWQDWTDKERARQAAELERIAHELLRTADEQSRQAAENARQTAEDARKQAETAREAAEALRQKTFEENEAQRQEDFENAEQDRIAAMTVTHCYVDVATMCLMFVQPELDSTEYKVRNGCLDITTRYEVASQ